MDDPTASAASATTAAARRLVERVHRVDNPAATEPLLDELMDTQRALAQIYSELQRWYTAAVDGLHFDGYRPGGNEISQFRLSVQLGAAAARSAAVIEALRGAREISGTFRWIDTSERSGGVRPELIADSVYVELSDLARQHMQQADTRSIAVQEIAQRKMFLHRAVADVLGVEACDVVATDDAVFHVPGAYADRLVLWHREQRASPC